MATPPDPERVRLVQEALIGRLVPDLVHQLRNPLNSILTTAALLAEKGDRAELRDKLLPVLSRSAERLRDLLAFADAWQQADASESVDLRCALADVLLLLQARNPTVTIHPADPGAPIFIGGERDHLRTLLLSLLEESLSGAKNDLWLRVTEASGVAIVRFVWSDRAVDPDETNSGYVREFALDLARYLGGTVDYEAGHGVEQSIALTLPMLVSEPDRVQQQ